ncbi:uncharacterized protein LOC121635572 isoform X2 [Melanotaenia boesemani]|uniref:uncharacterized protein LOC121635572 isoform X2 n=1 Tax=Melanotaenia boesemani TaxID=1250792 RepID=UPI001C0510FA|nr:uncharacterized protein LOC121635572 isoform X2 [Melanotaenia boesemani]
MNVAIKDFDRFHVFLSSGGPGKQTGETNQNEAPTDIEEVGRTLLPLLRKKAPQILKEYETTGILSVQSRKFLVKICVGDLVERCGFYPLSAEKLAVAKSIISAFPSLSVRVAGQGEGFEHFYDPVSHCGFLESKLRNLRRNLQQEQRRYRKRKVTTDSDEAGEPETTENETTDTTEWVTLTKRLRPSAENLSAIKTGMEKTYIHRRAWISRDSPTVEEIFNEYPRFLDTPCLLDSEFGRLTGGKTDFFLRRWEASIIPKLKSVAALENSTSPLLKGVEDKSEVGASRCSLSSAITCLIDFVPLGTSIASLFNPVDSSKTHQPQLMCIGDLRSSSRQYVIIAKNDRVTIPLDDGLACALDKLFKLYWVCNLSYPTPLSAVFTFLEYIYDLPFSTQRKTKVLELISKLKACK